VHQYYGGCPESVAWTDLYSHKQHYIHYATVI